MISSHSWGDPGSQKRIEKPRRPGRAHHDTRPTASRTDWREARANRDSRFFFGIGFGSDINGLHAQPVPRSDAAQNPVRYPFRSFDGGSVIDRQHSGTRTYDINTDGVDHYGLYPDWIEDLRQVAGQPDRRRHGQRRRGLPADVGARGGGRRPVEAEHLVFPYYSGVSGWGVLGSGCSRVFSTRASLRCRRLNCALLLGVRR